MLPTKKWADAHSLTTKEKAAKYISATNGTMVWIVGPTSIILLMVHTLELDIAYITIFSSDFYQGFLGCDLLCGHNKALGMAIIITAQSGLTCCYLLASKGELHYSCPDEATIAYHSDNGLLPHPASPT